MQVHFANVWQAIADEVGDRTALVHGDERVSWREYDEQAARLAQAFTDLGLRPDSKVALYLYNGNEYLEAQYAAFKMRGVPVNVNYRYLDDELLYLLDNSDAEALVLPHAARRPGRAGVAKAAEAHVRSSRSTTAATARRRRARATRRCSPRTSPMPRIERPAATTSTCCTPAARPACRRA